MTISELIGRLQQFEDQQTEVFVYDEFGDPVPVSNFENGLYRDRGRIFWLESFQDVNKPNKNVHPLVLIS